MQIEIRELSRQPLHQQVARQIRTRILTAELGENEELTPVRQLAREHRLSVASIKRAYRDLEEQGLITRGDREHYRVAVLNDEQRRAFEKQRLLEDLRRQEFSLRELELARDIQCRLLPPEEVVGEGWRVTSRSEPARFVAGDFHDVIRFPDGSVAVVVADVVGKGIGASLIMASVKAMLPFIAAERSADETIRELNAKLCNDLARREFVALAFVRLDPRTGNAQLINAGLPDPAVLQSNAAVIEIVAKGERLPLGLRRDVVWENHEFTLEPGQRLILTTDGIPEATDDSGELLGYEAWNAILNRNAADLDEFETGPWLDHVLDEVRTATSPHLDDDLTAVILERTA